MTVRLTMAPVRGLRLCVATLLLLALSIHHSVQAHAKIRSDIASAAACEAGRDGPASLDAGTRANILSPPKRGGHPVHVDIGLYVERLDSISEVDHSFQIETFMELIWCDPRLAYLDEVNAPDRKVFLEDRAREEYGRIWAPDIIFMNTAAPPDVQQEELIVFPDGTVLYEERVAVSLRTRYDFTKFPFDSQRLVIEIESFSWPSSDLILHRDESKIGFSEGFNIPSWDLTGFTSEVRNVREIRDRDTFSELLLAIEAERVSAPFVYRLILPLLLIVMISWSVFWLRTSDTGRFGVTFTTILTVVAFNFVVTDKLPNVPEVTYLETLFGFAFLFLLLVVIENTVADRLTAHGREDRAERVDALARVAFPVVFFVGAALVTYGFGIL
ncbi:MAG: hypothetical protein R8L07_01195 [Alphaproteobacteria bacterium]|nr:hypothetical protein [Alphaproteobacteria bacterium]